MTVGAVAGRQRKYFAHARYAVGLAGRFGLGFQVPLNHEDRLIWSQENQFWPMGSPVFLTQAIFDAPPGEHGPGIAERR